MINKTTKALLLITVGWLFSAFPALGTDNKETVLNELSVPSGAGEPGVRVLLVSGQESTISSRFFGTIKKIHVEESDHFKAGDPLVTFDCSELTAEQNVAKAQQKLFKTTNIANIELHEKKVVGNLEKDLSQIRVEEAGAKLSAVNTRIKNCRIHAPFSGQVVKLHVNSHETLQPGNQIMLIQNSKNLEVHMYVPSKWLTKIKSGMPFQAAIEETAKSYEAHVTAVGPRVDAVSRTVKIYAQLDEKHPDLLPGMSGYANFRIE